MLYDSYRSKMLRRRSRIEFFKRHFWKFLILFIFIAALISSVIMLKGTVLFANFQKTLEYGEKCEPSVSAFLSSCNIEFKHSDGTWREVQPSMPGRYAIRCYGTGIDGQRRYSQEEGFEITKREIKVSVAEDSVIYGEELTLAADVAYGDTVICNGFSYSDIDSASDEEKIMRVTPQLAFIKVLNEEGKNIAAIAYKIATEEKEVKILPREITIKVFGDTKEYDGTSLSSDKYEIVKGSVLPTDELRLIFDKSITDVDRIENTPADETITDHRSRDVKGLYKITYDIGYLEITPKIIYVDTGSLSIPYDGKSHFSKEYSLLSEVEDFFHGDKIELKSYPEFKYAGEYDNKLEFIVTDKNKRDVTNNYNVIIRNCGKIEIRKIPVLVTTASKRWDYDGKAHTLSDFDIIGLINGAKPEANAATFTYVTDATPGVKNKFSINIYDEEGAKVNSCYAIDYSYGILAVDKREISVKPSDVSFIYNGAAHTATGYDMTDGELAADQLLQSSTLTPKLAGSYTFKFSDGEVRILDKNNNDVTSNYDIIFETGIVTIEPRPIIIAMKYATREYDGTPLTSTAHEVKPAGGFDFALVSGHFVDSVTANGSQLIPGKSDNELVDCVIRDPGGNDMTANYRVDTTVAYLEITPRKITLETHSAKKIYDGAPLECAKAPVLYSGSLGKDHYLDMTECGAISEIGQERNTVIGTIRDAFGIDVGAYYEISYIYGSLTVISEPTYPNDTKGTLVIAPAYVSKGYDGKPLSANNIIVGNPAFCDLIEKGYTYEVTVSGSQTDPGISESTITRFKLLDPKKKDVTSEYSLEKKKGTIEVYNSAKIVKTLTVYAYKIQKYYDGTALTFTSEDYEILSSPEEGLSIIVTPKISINDPTEYITLNDLNSTADHYFSYKIMQGGNDVTDKYRVVFDVIEKNVSAYLTARIDKRTIEITANSISKEYNENDTEPLRAIGHQITFGTLLNGHKPYVIISGELKEIGSADAVVELVVILDSQKNDVSEYYEIITKNGKLQLTEPEDDEKK